MLTIVRAVDEIEVNFYKQEMLAQKHELRYLFRKPSAVVSLKKHIYTKRAQSKTYNDVKLSLNHGDMSLLVWMNFGQTLN